MSLLNSFIALLFFYILFTQENNLVSVRMCFISHIHTFLRGFFLRKQMSDSRELLNSPAGRSLETLQILPQEIDSR